MAFKFKTFAAVGALIGSLALVGCGQDEKDPNHIKVGVIVGAEQQVAEVAQKVAKDKYGLDVELVTFNDYVLPNEALSKGDIDANAFQHKPYLDQQLKDRGYKLVAVGNTFVYPIAGYSKKIKSLDELQDGSQVAVPNDPTNLGRSLLLLQKVGLIKLKDGVGLLPTVLDVVENPKNLKIVEPIGYMDMVALMNDCKYVLCDSGGVSKETYFAKKRCLFMLKFNPWKELVNREHIITIDFDDSRDRSDKIKIANAVKGTEDCNNGDLFGDGTTSEQVVEILKTYKLI